MATRPATIRGAGLTNLHYGLIAFIVISVASLAGLIFTLTRVGDLENRAATAERRSEHQGTLPGPVGSYYENEATARGTKVLAVVGADLGRLGDVILGNKEVVGATIYDQSKTLLGQIAAAKPDVVKPTDSLLTALRNLDGALTTQIADGRKLQEAGAEKDKKIDTLTQQLKTTRDTFESEVTDLRKQLTQLQEDVAHKLGDKDTQLADLQSTLEAREQQLQSLKQVGDKEGRDKDAEIKRLQRQIADLQKKIQELKGTFDPEAILKKADGRIVRAIPGSEIVYINLGANDNVKVGMTFEVFPQLGTSSRSLRGKASLELVTVMESSAEARVSRSTPGQPIMEGDIVVNIAYERGRKPKFVVRGDFDLNFDGQVDFDGGEQIAAIIRQWGGQVVPDLDESVDFVVIGLSPRVGDIPANASDVVRDQAERKLLERSEFQKLIEQARTMFIPVITQNQFLFLTGYSGDTAARTR